VSIQQQDESPAERYDRLALPFVQSYTPLLLAGVAVPGAARVLDHGAGTGEVSLEVHRRFPGAKVTALDPDAGLLDRLRAKAGADARWLRALTGTVDTLEAGISLM
jgi:trans-aconitate methyltransferase